MDRPARLPIDCPGCENYGVIALDDDRTRSCPLCNSGKRFFPGGVRLDLEQVEERRFGNGVVILRYTVRG